MKIVVLMATKPRFPDLTNLSIPSIAIQSYKPVEVVLVTDSGELTAHERLQLNSLLVEIKLTVLSNTKTPGAAGAWNTGLAYIARQHTDCFVSMLDDDDKWHQKHLDICRYTAISQSSDAVVSGIVIKKNDIEVGRNIPNKCDVDDFLTGNPGWQGSNTFISLNTLHEVGGFTEGLVSSNDKDLAIRVLSLPKISIAFTGQVSVDWNIGRHNDALSAPGSPQKIAGCRQFFKLYGGRMSRQQKNEYFKRNEQLFGIHYDDIV